MVAGDPRIELALEVLKLNGLLLAAGDELAGSEGVFVGTLAGPRCHRTGR